MSGQNVVTLKGTLLAGPPKASCSKFPGALVSSEFELRPPNKVAAVTTYHVRNLNSAGSYSGLDGVGSGETVTQATFLWLRIETEMLVRLTFDDGSGGSVVSVLQVGGLLVLEIPPSKFLKLLEAQGVGVVEWFASGNL